MSTEFGSNSHKEKSSIPTPHADLAENVKFFNLQMSRIRWLPDAANCPVRYKIYDSESVAVRNPETGKMEMSYRIKEYMNVIFIIPRGQDKESFNISFHQSARKSEKHRGFREELCAVLNHLGSLGYLENMVKNNNGTYRDSRRQPVAPGAYDRDDKWHELFGNR